MTGPPLSLILLPTLDCNVACDYCFEEKARVQLSREQLPGLTRSVLDHMEARGTAQAELYWQGGEAMLLGPAWFEHALETMGRAAACPIVSKARSNHAWPISSASPPCQYSSARVVPRSAM